MSDLSALAGKRVTGKRAGWNEQLPADSDLDPFDAPSADLAGILEIREVPAAPGYPAYTQILIGGNPADPRTVRAAAQQKK